MRILITGGAGYVGRGLVRLLIKSNHDLCVIDNNHYGYKRFKEKELSKFNLFTVSINDVNNVRIIIRNFQPDVIIHLAAIHFIPDCENKPTLAYDVNVTGLVSIIKECRKNTRFIFISSAAVYAPDLSPHKEYSSKILPMDIYGYTKLHGEEIVNYYTKNIGLKSTIIRLFNVVGPGETNPHLLPEIFAQLKSGITGIRLGNLKPKRDYIYIDDVSNGILSIAQFKGCSRGEIDIVNLGTGLQFSVSEIIEKIKLLSKYDFEVIIDSNRIRKSDRPYLCANIDVLKNKYGFIPQFTIDDTIMQMLKKPDLALFLIEKYKL